MPTPVNGFRQHPMGFQYEQTLELTQDVAFAYERSHAYRKSWHTHNRSMIICPRRAARVQVSFRGRADPMHVTSRELLYVAAGVEHVTEGDDSVYEVLALYPCDVTMQRVVAPAEPAAFLPRTAWFDALVDQFVRGRVRAQTLGPEDLAAIEWLLVSAAFAPSDAQVPAKPVSAGLEALLQAIDADVAAPWSLARLARTAHTSRASVARMFRRGVGMGPAAFVRQRRMQEALALLEQGSAPVSDVAEMVGYTSQAAFATAFRRVTGRAPTDVRRATAAAVSKEASPTPPACPATSAPHP